MRVFATAIFFIGQASHAFPQEAPTLKVGDPAPKLTVSAFVKGTPINEFEPGKVYVVELWATWCSPCVAAMPHLSTLQREYKDQVTIISINVLEQDQRKIEPFVEKMRENMDYTVAKDKFPVGAKGPSEGLTATNWLRASGRVGIPSAYIVDQEGKVAWMGHPMELDDPLKKVVAKTWRYSDFEAETVEGLEEISEFKRYRDKYNAALAAGDLDGAKSVADEMIELPSFAGNGLIFRLILFDRAKDVEGGIRYLTEMQNHPLAGETAILNKFPRLLYSTKRTDEAYAFAREMAEGPLSKNARGLNALAWTIVDPMFVDKIPKQDLNLALDLASRAVKLERFHEFLDTLAWAHFWKGDLDEAVRLEEEALAQVKGERIEYKDALAKFKAKKEKGP
jgi:thiol-disulfide isomerase/thioredoxin